MRPADQLQLRQLLAGRSEEIANRWYAAIRRTAFTHLRPAEVRTQLHVLTEDLITALLSEPFERQRIQAVGAGVARLHYLQPEAIAATQEVLAHELVAGLTSEQIGALQPRLVAILAAIAAGFFVQSRAMILEEQEQIRSALAVSRRRVEEERKSRAVAEAALRARNDVLSGVSHDLRTPLMTIKGRAQLLQRQILAAQTVSGEHWTRQLASIDGAATRMARMIDDLRDVASLQVGQCLPLDRQAMDLVALTRHLAAEYEETTCRHCISVDASIPELVGMWDRDRLERTLDNLLSNAVKYSSEDTAITVTVSQEESMARLEVHDQGQGIPGEDLPHIFDWFRRARNVASTRGSGIGLAVSRQIVEQHGGTIVIQSQEGVGTTVTVRLPLNALDGSQDGDVCVQPSGAVVD